MMKTSLNITKLCASEFQNKGENFPYAIYLMFLLLYIIEINWQEDNKRQIF